MVPTVRRLLRATMELIKLSIWRYIVLPLEALFVTEKTLSSALDQLDANTMPLNNNDKMPDLEVTDMSDDHLTIQLSKTLPLDKPMCTKKYSDSSDDIAVVHSGDQPNLHSILKGRNRTVSESSDEVFGVRGVYCREDSVSSILSTGSASEGPVSENDDPSALHRKKSVSFSEYIDSTTYKYNASVSTLHATLKKKSKRYRKKEAKIERRRRQSSGNEHEHSSEEQSSQPETSEGLDTGEEDDQDVVIDHQAGGELPEDPKVDPHEDDEEGANDVVATKQPPKKTKKSKKKSKKQKSGKEGFSEANAASHMPPETKGDSVTSEEGESGVECVSVTIPEDGERTNGVVNREGMNGDHHKQGEDQDCDSDDMEHHPAPATMAGLTHPNPERTKGVNMTPAEQAAEGASDTVISWKDCPPAVDQSDVTKCAFNFSNTMMYDLDED